MEAHLLARQPALLYPRRGHLPPHRRRPHAHRLDVAGGLRQPGAHRAAGGARGGERAARLGRARLQRPRHGRGARPPLLPPLGAPAGPADGPALPVERRRGERGGHPDRAAVHGAAEDPDAVPLVPRRHRRLAHRHRRLPPRLRRGGRHGFVKALNPTPLTFAWGDSEEEAVARSLAALEEQILLENPETIAGVLLESVVGSGGTFAAHPDYMRGVRALCDKYGIVYIADEVMVGFGRTGKMWGFQHYEGVVPDVVTSAKGLSGAYLPISMVAMSKDIMEFFREQPVGWGSTYHAHPVAMACAYECVKHMVVHDLVGNAARLESTMAEWTDRLVDNHPSVRQGVPALRPPRLAGPTARTCSPSRARRTRRRSLPARAHRGGHLRPRAPAASTARRRSSYDAEPRDD